MAKEPRTKMSGKEARYILKQNNVNLAWLSEQLGVNPSTVSKWCTNSSQPDVACLLKIAELLGVDIKELLVKEYDKYLITKVKRK